MNKVVMLPFCGVVSVYMEDVGDADDDSLIEAAMEKAGMIKIDTDAAPDCEVDEWEIMRYIVRGNVFRGVQCDASVEDA